MKKKLIAFIIIASLSTKLKSVYGQLKTETIVIDFSNLKKSSLTKKASRGSLVQLEIININRNQYAAQINNSQANFYTTQPKIFDQLNPSAIDISEKTLDKQTTGSSFASVSIGQELQNEIQSLTEKQTEFSDNLTLFSSNLEEYKIAVEAIKLSLKLKSMLGTISQDCSSDIPSILANANTEVKTFVTKYLNVLPAPVGTNQSILRGQVKIILEYYLTQASLKYKTLKDLHDKIDDLFPELQVNIDQLLTKIQKQSQIVGLSAKNRADLEAKKLIVNKISRTIKRDLKKENDIMKSVEEAYRFIEIYIASNEASNIFNQYGLFTDKNYVIISAEIIEKDELLFDVILQSKADAVCPAQTIHLPIKVRSKGGFKIDFSSGLFLNFGKNDFFDQTYRLDNLDSDPNNLQIVKNNNRNKVLPSLGALLHGYIRTGGDLQPAISLGVSLSAGETSRLNYHLGPSLIIGKDQRLIASFGWTLAQSAILDGKYVEGQVLPKATAPQTLETTSYYRWGNFLSLNYNLSR